MRNELLSVWVGSIAWGCVDYAVGEEGWFVGLVVERPPVGGEVAGRDWGYMQGYVQG